MQTWEIIIIILCQALWVAAWLRWVFVGSLRQLAFCYLFPKSWRVEKSRTEIKFLLGDEVDLFISAESNAPPLLRELLTCPECMSAHVSFWGLLPTLTWLFFSTGVGYDTIGVAFLVWAGGAWVGNRFFDKI